MSRYKRLPFENKKKKQDEFISAVDTIFSKLAPFASLIFVLVIVGFIGGFVYLFLSHKKDSDLTQMNAQVFEVLESTDAEAGLQKLADEKKYAYLPTLELLHRYATAGNNEKLDAEFKTLLEEAPAIVKNYYVLHYAHYLVQNQKWDEATQALGLLTNNKTQANTEFASYLKALIALGKGNSEEGLKTLKELSSTATSSVKEKAVQTYLVEQTKGNHEKS
ncbi:hypothetical protein K1X76_02520 [bacterium]|nr:hypothetical protein [bacterium]